MGPGAVGLGIIGGIIGLALGGLFMVLGAIPGAWGNEYHGPGVGPGGATLGFSVVGLVGGALAMAKPRTAAVLMLVGGIGGFVSVSLAYVVAGPLLLVGALLAFLGRRGKA